MKITCAGLVAILTSAAQAAGIATIIDRSIPLGNDRLRIEQPMAAVCPDGAIWLYWHQVSRPSRAPLSDDPSGVVAPAPLAADTGAYYKLIRRDGRDLVAVRKLTSRLPLHYLSSKGDTSPAAPFYLCSTPDGSAVAFTRNLVETGEPKTRITVITRSGATGHVDVPMLAGGGGYLGTRDEYQLSGRGSFQVRFAPDGAMHCFCWDARTVGYAKVVFADKRPKLSEFRRYYPYGKPGTTPAIDTTVWKLMRLAGPRDFAATFLMGQDTVAAAYTDQPRAAKYIEAGRADSLTVHRFVLPSLSWVGTSRAACRDVAGVNWQGISIATAMAVSSEAGTAFLVPGTGMTESYDLSRSATPLTGTRRTQEAAPYSPKGKFVHEEVVFLKRQPYWPWQIEWYGVDDELNLHVDARVCDSVPGRLR